MPFNRKRNFLVLGLLLFSAAFLVGCQRVSERLNIEKTNAPANAAATKEATVADAHLPFGNPSNANENDADNFLLVHDGHVISYNNSRGTLNWAAWWTRKSDLGEALERPLFQPDMTLPSRFTRIVHSDYSGSGYDRGHMVPSADRFGDPKRNEDTFVMTNIVPQSRALNQYPWQKLESYARRLARNGASIYTIAGVYGDIGRLKGRVAVPSHCWKVIVVLRSGRRNIDAATRIIAVDMPNIEGIENEKWENYRTSVRSIEEKTGLDLFSALPRDLQDTIETRVDTGRLPAY